MRKKDQQLAAKQAAYYLNQLADCLARHWSDKKDLLAVLDQLQANLSRDQFPQYKDWQVLKLGLARFYAYCQYRGVELTVLASYFREKLDTLIAVQLKLENQKTSVSDKLLSWLPRY